MKCPYRVVKKVAKLYVCERALDAAPKYKTVLEAFGPLKWDAKVLSDPKYPCTEKVLCDADWQPRADLKQPYAKAKCLHDDEQKCTPLAQQFPPKVEKAACASDLQVQVVPLGVQHAKLSEKVERNP